MGAVVVGGRALHAVLSSGVESEEALDLESPGPLSLMSGRRELSVTTRFCIKSGVLTGVGAGGGRSRSWSNKLSERVQREKEGQVMITVESVGKSERADEVGVELYLACVH